ncbi:MAG TPA: peptidyl-prolyl cis-trans isomerase [Anaerolineae bacterium]|nr:peptidyl-prolyl cis-trans isomerase [Anaerolineae bacterium]
MMKKLSVFALMALFGLAVAGVDILHCGSPDTRVLAEVNGEFIDEDALYERLKDIHRYKPQIRPEEGAGSIKITDIVEDIIDERLMIQEAYRVELDRSVDFTKKIESFVTTQSILRLRKEEILDKTNISEQDILEYFKERYEKDGPAPEGMFKKVEPRIRKNLGKEKEKELSDNFISELRKQADIWIDSELINLLDLEKNYTGEKSVVASVNDDTIPTDDFLHDLKQATQKQTMQAMKQPLLKNSDHPEKTQNELKEKIVDNLIAFKLIDQEALRRNYVNEPAFMDMVKNRKERLLINEFKAKLIYPLIIPTENELTQYYEKHIDDYKKGYEVWFGEMIFNASKDAEKALKELKQGAGFEFLAARVSERWIPRQRAVWVNADSFSPAISKELNRLKPGEISNVIADDRQYRIIKLKGKRGGKPIEFFRVVDKLKKATGQKKFNEIISEYLTKLRKESGIKINKKALKQIEEKYRVTTP